MGVKINKIIFFHKSHENLVGGIPIIDERNKSLLATLTDSIVDISYENRGRIACRLLRYVSYIKAIFKNVADDVYHELKSEIEHPETTVLFVSHSTFGTIIRKLKKEYPTLRVYCFFHNVEITMAYNRLKFKFRLIHIYEWIYNYISELYVGKYADVLLALNARDARLINKLYTSKEVSLLPTSLFDRNPDNKLQLNVCGEGKCLRLLFVGTYFWGNIPGLQEFIEEVMPHVNVVFSVVGNNMECLKETIRCGNNVFMTGRVDEETLNDYYRNADVFIAPILSGGGMKTKVAEAMMFGLPVIGTEEAFCGYDDDVKQMGFVVSRPEDYIQRIKELDCNRELLYEMSKHARDIFEQKYSIDSSLRKLNALMQ